MSVNVKTFARLAEAAGALSSERNAHFLGGGTLLLDEIAGGLTDLEVTELTTIIRGLRAEGIAVLWIEHVVRALLSTVDRLLCLSSGAIIADGEPKEVMASEAVRSIYLGGKIINTAVA